MESNYMKHLFKCLFIGLSVCAPIQAQHVFTLDECIEEALQNNIRMKNAKNNLQIAKDEKQEAFTKFFPTISASGGGFTANNGLVQMDMGEGMEMSMLKNGIVGGVNAAMPLFTGGQIINANKLAKVNMEVSRLQKGMSENEVTLTVEKYFWQIITLKEKAKTLTTVETQLDRLTKDVEAAVQAGITTRNDLLQIKLKQNETKSQQIQLANMLHFAQNLLAQYMGYEADSIAIESDIKDQLPTEPSNLYQNPEVSLKQTNEYNLLEQNVKANRLQHKIAIGKNLPTIAIGGGYVYHNLLDKDQTFWMGFATVSIPISGWWGGSYAIRKQKVMTANAENQLHDQSQLLMIQMNHTWNDLNDAYKQVQIAMQSISQATENLRLNNDYYTAGTCTMSDLLDAQTLYQQSRDKYIEAYAQYEIKKREYLQITGR